MSPEVINNNKCGIYSDLWSLACVLYTMVYNFQPFIDKTEYLIFQNILNLNYRFPSNKTVISEIKDLIKNLLKLNPLERIGANGKLEKLKNHSFFNRFEPYNIEDDLKNAFNAIRVRRYSIDFKEINIDKDKKSLVKIVFKQAKFKKPEKSSIQNDKTNSKEKNILLDGCNSEKNDITTNIVPIDVNEEEFDKNYYFENLKKYEIVENNDEFLPNKKIQEEKTRNYSDKELTLKFELNNKFQFGNNKEKYVIKLS